MSPDVSHKVETLILGGGLAGLSAAYHLPKNSYLLVEREKQVGGTARSFKVGKFTFDFTGHLLHLHHPETRALITRLLRGNFYRCQRKAWIFSCNRTTRYPYQANTNGLPGEVVDDCVMGFLNVALNPRKPDYQKLNFERWSGEVFGAGISRHFMVPYNQKLYQTPPNRLTVDWCGAFVPKVSLEEVIQGALMDQKKGFGYNTEFLYPKKGGIHALAEALAKNLPNIRVSTSIVRLDIRKKTAWLSDGTVVRYKNLVNTIPLKSFLQMCDRLPAPVQSAGGRLRAAGVLCLNIGVNRARISPASWIYFPEPKYPFYRVGFPMNFTPHVVPRGCSSMYVEVPLSHAQKMSPRRLLRDVRAGLVQAKILKTSDRWLVTQVLPIPTAYVIYDRKRNKALDAIFSFFSRHRIRSIGRYGAWKYSFMEEAILDGKKTAEAIRAGKN